MKEATYESSVNFVKWTEHCISGKIKECSFWLKPDQWETRSEAYRIVYKKWFLNQKINSEFLKDSLSTDNRELAELIYHEIGNTEEKVYLALRWGFI